MSFITEGEDIFDRFMQREKRKELNHIRNVEVPKLKDKMIWNELGSELVESGTAIREIRKKTGIEDSNEIAQSINRLIDKEHVVSSKARKSGKVFLQRNPFNKPK